MPASIFLKMNRHIKRAFQHPTKAIWRHPLNTDGDELTVLFNQTSEQVTADGFSITSDVPTAVVFVEDVQEIDPSRTDVNELFYNDRTTDTLEIDGIVYGLESCTSDGYGKVNVELVIL